ncbi:hypothetical protein [Lysobacter gummosus]|uniref:hypothetical protein n=1 Tax=Lysobacter gummosus TaxID=262324 RepID=UPI0036368DCD
MHGAIAYRLRCRAGRAPNIAASPIRKSAARRDRNRGAQRDGSNLRDRGGSPCLSAYRRRPATARR